MAGRLVRDPAPWRERRDRALGSPVLRANIGSVTRRLAGARQRAYADYPAGQALRVAGRDARRRAVAGLEPLLGQLRDRLAENGAHVIFAAGPSEVSDYIVSLAARRGAKRVVKSKSMLTEELDLNRRLASAGLAVRETDLGEYIIQLLDERPSHILAPAAHRNRGEIHAVFQEAARREGVAGPSSDGVGPLTAFARERLRQDFLAADIGITGANFLVAETGTVVLVTNEGNADMVVSLPPVHVVVAGIDKVLAAWEDLAAVIQQPALSGVGQRLSAYTTLVSGPRAPGAAEGPEELHVLLVDNGRRQLLGGPYADVLTCIRCGACYNVCPVYRQVGGHAYGSTYAGPIGAVETPLLAGLDFLPELPQSLCTLCSACEEACPMDIALPHHLITLRRRQVEEGREPTATRLTYRAWGRLWSSLRQYRRFVSWARRGQRFLMHQDRLVRAPGLWAGWFETRDMPPIAAETFHEWWARRLPPESAAP